MAAGLPGAIFRSPTAVAGQGDYRDIFVYSSIIAAYGGTGTQRAFTAGIGQAIPAMKGSSITLAAVHHLTHSKLTTNLSKSGEVGADNGDVAVRAVGIQIEPAPIKGTTGAAWTITGYDTYGATPQDVAEFCNKVSFELKVGGKSQITGPVTLFPGMGALAGAVSVATTANNVERSAGLLANGSSISGGKKFYKFPISIARNDVLVGEFEAANGSTLGFVTTSGAGQETLVTVVLGCLTRGDVR
jgi:hypothetical protein